LKSESDIGKTNHGAGGFGKCK